MCWSRTKEDIIINSLKFNLFSWYRWQMSHLALNSNHSLISIAIDNSMVMVMTFNTTFNNISVVLWRSVLLLEETGENHRPVAIHWQTLSYNVIFNTPCHEQDSKGLAIWRILLVMMAIIDGGWCFWMKLWKV
jgi:hypothetical protein